MTRLEKCLKAIELGYKYNPETGEVTSFTGHILNSKNADGYSYIRLYGSKLPSGKIKSYLLFVHHFAYYWVYGKIVHTIDHINGVKYDARICNLKEVTTQQNCYNRKPSKGCRFVKERNKWKAVIHVNRKSKFIGYFNTYEEAHEAYLREKKKYHIINNINHTE